MNKLFINHLVRSLFFLVGIGCCAACAHTSKETKRDFPQSDQPSREQAESNAMTNQAANQIGANYYVEVEFQPGSHELETSAKESIDALIDRAYQTGKTTDVMVLSWSDKTYPQNSQEKISKEQRNLAARRNDAIKNYVKSTHEVDVETYNMAEPPNFLQSMFRTTDAQLKQALVDAGLPTNPTDERYLSKESHAVVLVRTK